MVALHGSLAGRWRASRSLTTSAAIHGHDAANRTRHGTNTKSLLYIFTFYLAQYCNIYPVNCLLLTLVFGPCSLKSGPMILGFILQFWRTWPYDRVECQYKRQGHTYWISNVGQLNKSNLTIRIWDEGTVYVINSVFCSGGHPLLSRYIT